MKEIAASSRILVAGATGFTGAFVLGALARLPQRPLIEVYVRHPDRLTGIDPQVAVARIHVGALENEETLSAALEGVSCFICVASMGFGHAPGILRALSASGVKRAIFVSTTGIFTKLNPASKAVRLAAEAAIQNSDLAWTIIRPTMICGAPGDRNMERLLKSLRRFPFLPIPGTGRNLMQPVYVGDVASAIASACVTPSTVHKAYAISGRSPISFNDLVAAAGRIVSRRIWVIHLPLGPILWLLRTTEAMHIKLPITSEQILRLDEDKAFPWDAAAADFGYSPRSAEEILAMEWAQINPSSGIQLEDT